MKTFRRLLMLGCAAIMLAGWVRYRRIDGAADGQREDVEIQESYRAARGNLEITVGVAGTIEAEEELPLFFTAQGNVAQVLVEVGEWVVEGQPLAQLDTEQLGFALRDAQIAYQAQQVTYDQATAPPREVDLKAAEAALSAAQAQLGYAVSAGATEEQIRIAELQVEVAKNQKWQAQIQRDNVKNLGTEADTVEVPQEFIDELPEDAREDFPTTIDIPGFTPDLADMESYIVQAEQGVVVAQQQLEKAQSQGAPASQVAQARAAVRQAEAALEMLQDGPSTLDRELLTIQLELARLALEQAQHDLDQATLRAPFDGIVARINLTEDEPPPTQDAAIVMVDNSAYHMIVNVDEIDIAAVEDGQEVRVTLDALPGETITGTVGEIAETAFGLGGIVVYPVRVDLDPTAVNVRIGMSATASIITESVEDALIVPNRFITISRGSGQASVVVRRAGGEIESVNVELGRRNESHSEITAGLREGDEVLLIPRSSLDRFFGR